MTRTVQDMTSPTPKRYGVYKRWRWWSRVPLGNLDSMGHQTQAKRMWNYLAREVFKFFKRLWHLDIRFQKVPLGNLDSTLSASKPGRFQLQNGICSQIISNQKKFQDLEKLQGFLGTSARFFWSQNARFFGAKTLVTKRFFGILWISFLITASDSQQGMIEWKWRETETREKNKKGQQGKQVVTKRTEHPTARQTNCGKHWVPQNSIT